MLPRLSATLACCLIALQGNWLNSTAGAEEPSRRLPAVSGLFYPKDPTELSKTVDALLDKAETIPHDGHLKALLCPHAGYRYSGPVAASAYRLLKTQHFEKVFILAPSHYALTENISVAKEGLFSTPIGDAAVDSAVSKRLTDRVPFAWETSATVQRPAWWRQASCPAPRAEDDTPHTWEHAIEVQLPFLQRTLSQFKIVPLVFGQVDPAKAASVLEETLDDSTLLIVSSDLSHYDTYANAKRRDQTCIDSILQLKPEAISTNDACGAIPIQTLLAIAKSRGWTPVLLDYRNSGDTTGETEQGVVGYAAVAFYAESEPPRLFSAAQHDDMLHLARSTLNAVRNKSANDPTPRTKDDPLLEQPRGCFVTLKLHGRLRGCMGNITPSEPLAKAIVSNTRLAALRDPRFEPVSRAEIPEIEIEISVLTQPTPVAFESSEELLEKITPGKDGILLQIGNKSATYLPQVWEQLPDKVEFFNSLAEKAGCPAAAWHDKNTKVFTYQVESFKETARP